MKIFLNLFFLFQVYISSSQEKVLHGKIHADANVAEGINIINLVNEKTAISDNNGEFFILAKEDDLLVFSAPNFEYKRKIIENADIKSGNIQVKMVLKPTQIEEVVIIKNRDLDVVGMGILDRPAKKYTPAERKLKTAGDFKPVQLLGLLGGQLPIDPIINAINGKTKRLKKELSVEQRELLLEQLSDIFTEDYYIQTLKIPAKNIRGFQFFAIEDDHFSSVLRQKNKTHLSLLLIQLAENYHRINADEK